MPPGYDPGSLELPALDPHVRDWPKVIGNRIRRLRRARSWTLSELARYAWRPNPRPFDPGYLSRIERGLVGPPLIVYLGIAWAFQIDPGRLLGPDAALLDASEPELTLLRTIRELDLEPHEAMAMIAQATATEMRSSSPSIRAESPPATPS